MNEFYSDVDLRIHITADLQKIPFSLDLQIHNFVNLLKLKWKTNAKRKNSLVGFHPRPNAEIQDPRGFEERDLQGTGYQTLPKKYLKSLQLISLTTHEF